MKVYKLKRDILNKECPWIHDDNKWKKGDIVFAFTGFTYGCVSKYGKAVRKDPTEDVFTEIPLVCLEEIGLFEINKKEEQKNEK